MSQELAVMKPQETAKYLATKEADLARWCNPQYRIDPAALTRFALHDMQRSVDLQSCTPISIYLALLACAVTGLEPGPLKGEAYLIPRKVRLPAGDRMEATFMIGWRGIVRQARRAGIDPVSNVVRERDVFDIDLGTQNFVKHKPNLIGPSGAIIGAVAWATLPGGTKEIEWLDLERIEKIRRSGGGGDSEAWTKWFDQMARKSALRSIGKKLPMGADYFHGAQLDRAYEGAADAPRPQTYLDDVTDGAASRGSDRAMLEAAAFSPGPTNPVSVQVPAAVPPSAVSEGTRPSAPASTSKPRGAARVLEARTTENPTTPATSTQPSASPAASSSPASTASASTPSAVASPAAPAAPTTSSTSTTRTEAPVPTSQAGTAASTTSTPSASLAAAPTESSNSAPSDQDFGDFGNGGFGNDPVDVVPPPAKNMQTFAAAMAACRSRKELRAAKPEWIQWSRIEPTPAECDPPAMAALFAKRNAELPE
jgi:phage RecT family recombinase